MAARIFLSDSASESAGSEVLVGDGVIGDLTGIGDTQCLAAAGTTPGAGRSITGAIFIVGQAGAELTVGAVESHAAGVSAVELTAGAAEFTTIPAQLPGLSTETGRRLADTLHLAVRAASARAHSAATVMADKPGAFLHAEGPASAAADRTAVARVAAEVTAAGVIDLRCARDR